MQTQMAVRSITGSRHFAQVRCGWDTTTNFGWCVEFDTERLDGNGWVEDANLVDNTMIQSIGELETLVQANIREISDRQTTGLSGEKLAALILGRISGAIEGKYKKDVRVKVWPLDENQPVKREFTAIARVGGRQAPITLFEQAEDFVFEKTTNEHGEGPVVITPKEGKPLTVSRDQWTAAKGHAATAYARVAATLL